MRKTHFISINLFILIGMLCVVPTNVFAIDLSHMKSLEPNNFSSKAITLNFDELSSPTTVGDTYKKNYGLEFDNAKAWNGNFPDSNPNVIESIDGKRPITIKRPNGFKKVGIQIDSDGYYTDRQPQMRALDKDGNILGIINFDQGPDFVGMQFDNSLIYSIQLGCTAYGAPIDSPSFSGSDAYDNLIFERPNLTITDKNLNFLQNMAKWKAAPKLGEFLVWPPTGLDAPYIKKINIIGVTTKKNQIFGVETADYTGQEWGQCVSLAKALSKSKVVTGDWIKGAHVIDTTDLAPGTVIATFTLNGKYDSKDTTKEAHTAIFRDYIKSSGKIIGIKVWDQNYVQSIKKDKKIGKIIQDGAVGRHDLYLYTIDKKGKFTNIIRNGKDGANDYYVVTV